MPDTKLILDFDGVFVDFAGASCEVHGRPEYQVTSWDFFKDWGITAEEFWEPIRSEGEYFYENIVRPYPWAHELLAVCREFDENCVFASVAAGGHAEDYSGKLRCVRKYFGDMPLIILPGTTERTPKGVKHMLAAPDRVLIDDSDANVSAFCEHGGSAITFPQPWNAALGLTDKRVEHVRKALEKA